MRICNKCKIEKDLSFYVKSKSHRGGLSSWCRDCRTNYDRERRKKFRELGLDYYNRTNKRKYDKGAWKSRYSTIEGRTWSLLRHAKNRSAKNGWDYNLDKNWLIELFQVQDSRCILTGIEFDFLPRPCPVGEKWMNPFAPSLDRIDCIKGYTKDNVRLVCVGINIALGNFGTESFTTICREFLRKQNETSNI